MMSESPEMKSLTPSLIDYASPAEPDKPSSLVRAAKFLGLAPLIAGCLIFLLWIPTRSVGLALAGLLNIAVGTILFLIGMLILFMHLSRLQGPRRFARFLSSSWLALLLLLINFPTAYAIIRAVDYIETHYPNSGAGPD
jgi:multisubunit Na+/H+ antiporter MnhB subunit